MSADDDRQCTIAWLTSNNVKDKRITSSICASYTNWKPREAFRELVQNWRDSIIQRHRIEERNFLVVRRKEKLGSLDIVYSAFHLPPWSNEKICVGYIRFDNAAGTVDISNRNATLEPYHINMGESTKRTDVRQAGEHGDGLIIAILTLMRSPQNYSVRCLSGGYRWTFNFTKTGLLRMTLKALSAEALEDHTKKACSLPFAVNAHDDVQFILGEKLPGRDDEGDEVDRRRITREEFKAWTRAALFLDHELSSAETPARLLALTTKTPAVDAAAPGAYPPRVITDDGDLLISEHLRGRIYFKGLLLRKSIPAQRVKVLRSAWGMTHRGRHESGQSASSTGLPLRFGYNFSQGTTNRDRLSVGTAKEESRLILGIWVRVIGVQKDLVKDLSDMLNTRTPRYADVAWADSWENRNLSKTLRNYLIGAPFETRWYYSAGEKATNPRLSGIIRGLGREGFELTNTYWRMFDRHGLFHTAEEEERRRFMMAPRIGVLPCTTFAGRMDRLLRACIQACPAMEGLDIRFARAGHLSLQLYVDADDRLIIIHERWLSIEGAAQELGLPQTMPEQSLLHSAIRQLFGEAIHQLPDTTLQRAEQDGKASGNGRTTAWYRNLEITRMGMRLINYMFAQPFTTKQIGYRTVRVSWRAGNLEDESSLVEVHCHREATCFHLRHSLLLAEDAQVDKLACLRQAPSADGETARPRTCPCLVRQIGKSKHWDVELDLDEKFFFVLITAPADPRSIAVVSDIVRLTGAVPILPHRAPVAADRRRCFYVEKPLASRDIILDVGKDWHEGVDRNNRRAVIGILPEEAPSTGNKRPNKRPRLDDDDDVTR